MATDAIVTDESLSSVLDISQDARKQALALVDLLLQQAESGEAPDELAKQQKLLMTNLSQLRGLHRAAYFAARETKSQTAEARQEVDRLHLQLQNLHYEQRHLEGEIGACESYDHKYRQLPLVPVEEFLQIHPDLSATTDEHELMVARIEQEKVEREKLEQQRQELLKRKAKLIADNKKRKDDLANLDKDLEKFIDAAKPIEKTFESVV